jgi:hypothetical protein
VPGGVDRKRANAADKLRDVAARRRRQPVRKVGHDLLGVVQREGGECLVFDIRHYL